MVVKKMEKKEKKIDEMLEWSLRECGLTDEEIKRKEDILDEIAKRC